MSSNHQTGFLSQVSANCVRKLITYINKPRDVYASLNAFFVPVIYMTVFLTYIKILAKDDQAGYEEAKK